MFGHKWTSIATSDDGTWLSALRGVTPGQLMSGIMRVENGIWEWPPSLSEFKMLCLGVDHGKMEEFIRKQALERFSSFDRKQMSVADEQRHIKQARQFAMELYVEKAINENITAMKMLPAQ